MAQAEPSWSYDWVYKGASSDSVVMYQNAMQNANMHVFSVVTGSELGGSGRAAAKQQLHCRAAGRHLLGTGASEELQGLSPLQYHPE